jgi:hypothetical protein
MISNKKNMKKSKMLLGQQGRLARLFHFEEDQCAWALIFLF